VITCKGAVLPCESLAPALHRCIRSDHTRIHGTVCYVGGKVSLLSPASLKKAGVGSPPKKKPKLWKSKWQLATLSGGKKFPSLRLFFVCTLLNEFLVRYQVLVPCTGYLLTPNRTVKGASELLEYRWCRTRLRLMW